VAQPAVRSGRRQSPRSRWGVEPEINDEDIEPTPAAELDEQNIDYDNLMIETDQGSYSIVFASDNPGDFEEDNTDDETRPARHVQRGERGTRIGANEHFQGAYERLPSPVGEDSAQDRRQLARLEHAAEQLRSAIARRDARRAEWAARFEPAPQQTAWSSDHDATQARFRALSASHSPRNSRSMVPDLLSSDSDDSPNSLMRNVRAVRADLVRRDRRMDLHRARVVNAARVMRSNRRAQREGAADGPPRHRPRDLREVSRVLDELFERE
jgi:hypothetical protein